MPRKVPARAPGDHKGRPYTWIVVLILALACGKGAPGDGVVARVGEQEVTWAEFDAYLRASVDEPAELGSAALSRLFDQYLEGVLLVHLAQERGQDPEATDPRDAVAYLLAQEGAARLSEDTARAHYAAHRADYARPERVRVRQILVETRDEADAAMAALAGGESFPQVARRMSNEPRAGAGGDQGWLARDDLPLAFADVLDSLAPGEVSEPVEADYGYHIFQVVDRSAAATLPYEEVARDVRQDLERRRVDGLVADFVATARERLGVEIFPQSFPFDYQGSHALAEDTSLPPPRRAAASR